MIVEIDTLSCSCVVNPSYRMNEGVDFDLPRSGSISGRTQYTFDDEKGHNQRQSVPKLSREELEDRFYRVYDQNIEMKKRLNNVENKNRRLTTKLIRLSRNPYGIDAAETEGIIDDQAQRLQQLEQSEATLRVKVKVLREQLAAHTRLHSAALHRRHVQPARNHVSRQSRSQTRESDGTRSAYTLESVRSRSYSLHQRTQSEDSNQRSEENLELKKQINSLRDKIAQQLQDFDAERKQYQEKVSELEAELSKHLSADTAENVEIIRLRRSIRQHEVALSSLQQEFAGAQRDLLASRNALAQAARDHEVLSESVVRERQKYSSLQQEIALLTQECASARDLADQIADVKRENATLKEHNSRLLLLTTDKNNTVITSNGEFKELTSSTIQQLREECAATQKEAAEARAERSAANRQLEAARQECAELRRRADEERVNAETWREAHQRLQMKLDDVNFQMVTATKRLDDLTNQLFSGQDLDKNKKHFQENWCNQATQTVLESNPSEFLSTPTPSNCQNTSTNGLPLPDACLSLLEQTAVGIGSAGSMMALSGASLQDRFFKLCTTAGTGTPAVMRPQSVSDVSVQDHEAPTYGRPTPTPAPRRARSHEQMTLSVGQLDAIWELEKYRELLRVQCNLNNMYKKEVTSLNQIVRSLASGST